MKLANKYSVRGRCLVQGIGINDAVYNVNIFKNKKIIWTCPFYRKWSHMLQRCYSVNCHKKQPTYVGCSVCPEWRYFSKFRIWMELQNWKGMELDKDLLVKGNKVYGPDTCCFLPKTINGIFHSGKKKKNLHLPEGVSLRNGKYSVQICTKPNKKYTKTLPSLKEAHIHSLEKKIEAVQYGIISYPELDARAVIALNREINGFQEKINIIQNSSPNLFDIA
jgi:hypothetical protein